MKLVTWNINGIKARVDRVVAWIEKHDPDVLCLQEIKSEDSKFPVDRFKSLGYEVHTHGQKAYNGVAIISRHPCTNVTRGFEDDGDETQSRFIAADINGRRIASVYVPNGEAVGTEKYKFKLSWFSRFKEYIAARKQHTWAIGGDFNVCPEDVDVYDPKAWKDKVLCSTIERTALKDFAQAGGLTDSTRKLYPTEKMYTWWDYRMNGFPRDLGMRIDFFWVSDGLVPKLKELTVDTDERGGEKASDHAPVVLELD